MFDDTYVLTQAVLDGRKIMTRRLAKPATDKQISFGNANKEWYADEEGNTYISAYEVGEVVAIAQSYETLFHSGNCPNDFFVNSSTINEKYCGAGFSNKMFVKAEYMPLHIKITGVKLECLQDISDEDCIQEGIYRLDSANGNGGIAYSFVGASSKKNIGLYSSPREAFVYLIDKVSGKGTWERNPFVWVYEFELIN